MADRIVTVDVQSNLREQTQEAKQLNKELDKLDNQRTASRTGSRAADAALGVSDVGLRRGTTGAGGRGGERDFARQAQGLGGLVHVYATFAANIYAVTAAFNALQKAADTTTMVQGADTLSARYGVSLKNVGRELQAISGQALSTADALSFASLGASAGVTQKQMGQLATVATGASKALGRDLNDAMQRIYRGAIKLEPELLDELGIMVKVDEASATYARSLGKTALQLTDVEKRQAFVNAVIEQGSRKFGEAAEIAANPYTKLVAAMRDLGQNTLEVVNTGIGPLVNLLSQSPTALVSVVTLLIGKLAKMAMPDILPKAEERFSKASEQLEAAAVRLKKANKEIAKAFEETPAFQFITGDTKSKTLKNAAPIIKSLQEAIEKDIELTKPGQRVKLSVDTESLRAQAEQAIQKAIANAESRLRRSTRPETRAAREADIKNSQEMLNYVQNLSYGWDKVADSERVSGKERSAQNLATIQMLKEQRDIKVAQLQLEGKHLLAIKAAWDGQRAITKELQQQNASYDKSNILTNVKGAFSGIGAVVKTAGASVVSFLGTLGMYGAVASMVVEGASSIAKHFGWMTDKFDKVSESSEKLDNNLKTLEESLTKLGKAKSLQDIFELKQGQLKLIGDLVNQLDELKTKLEETASATGIDKFIDKLKEIPGVPGMSGAQQYAAGIGKTAALLGKTGQLDLVPLQEELTSMILQQLPQAARSQRAARLKGAGIQELLTQASTQADAGTFSTFLAALEGKISTIGKTSAEASAQLDQASASQKELSKLTKDYITSLVPQTIQTRMLSEASKGLVVSLANIDAASKSLEAFNDDLFILAGYTDQLGIKELKNAQQALKTWDTALANGQVTEKQAEEGKKRVLAEYKTTQLMSDVVFKLQRTAENAANAAIKAEVNMAKLSAQLRKLSAGEAAFGGPTEATTRKRLELEKAMIAQERQALLDQQSYIKDFIKIRTSALNAQLGTGTGPLSVDASLESIRSRTQAIAAQAGGKLYSEENAKLLKEFQDLVAVHDSLYQAKMANAALDGKLQVLALKYKSAEEQRLELNKVIEENRQKLAKQAIDANEEAYRSAKSYNDSLVNLVPELTNINALELERFSIANEFAQALEKQRQAEIKLAQARAAAQKSGDIGQRAREAIPGLETELGTVTEALQGMGRAVPARLAAAAASQTTAQTNLLKSNIEAELTAQKSIAQSALATNQDRYAASSRIVEITSKEYDLKLKTLDTEIQSRQMALDIANTNNEKANSLAIQAVLTTKIAEQKALELEKQKAITLLKVEEANAAMKVAEGSGGGMLSPAYWKSMGDYAINYFKQIESSADSVGAKFVKGMEGAIDTIGSGLADMLAKNELSWKGFADLVRSTFASLFKELAAEFMKLAIKKAILTSVQMAGFMFADGGIMTPNGPAKFANGGIMSNYGPVRLAKYAEGGIATGPQLALYGEGSRNEAYVPLPDNRTIPVTLTGSAGSSVSIGDTTINVTVNGANGDTQVSSSQSTDMARVLAGSIKQAVQEEFIKQSRPGGLIYSTRR